MAVLSLLPQCCDQQGVISRIGVEKKPMSTSLDSSSKQGDEGIGGLESLGRRWELEEHRCRLDRRVWVKMKMSPRKDRTGHQNKHKRRATQRGDRKRPSRELVMS